jgi:hypothetical protein
MNKLKKISLIGAITAGVTAITVLNFVVFNPNPEGSVPLGHETFEATSVKLEQLLTDKDPSASFDYLRSAIQDDTALARDCHPLLHHLGHDAYDKYKDFDTTIAYQDGLCNSGYTHGVIEAHFTAATDIQQTLRTTCKNSAKPTFQEWQCDHGIGHGAMYYNKKDLPASIAMCESLSSDFARSACINGAYMERFVIVNHGGEVSSATDDVTPKLCADQPQQYKADCYLYAPTAHLQRNTNDYAGTIKECQAIESRFISTCIQGVGSQAIKDNPTQPGVVITMCKNAPDQYVVSCIEGAVSLLINHHGSPGPVEPLCSTTFADYTSLCQAKVTAWKSVFGS